MKKQRNKIQKTSFAVLSMSLVVLLMLGVFVQAGSEPIIIRSEVGEPILIDEPDFGLKIGEPILIDETKICPVPHCVGAVPTGEIDKDGCPVVTCVLGTSPGWSGGEGGVYVKRSYFIGEGFLLNENENKGLFVDLKIFRDSCLIGDANGDGEITPKDAQVVTKIYLGKIPEPYILCCIDTNGDGEITPKDVQHITNYYLGNGNDIGNVGRICDRALTGKATIDRMVYQLRGEIGATAISNNLQGVRFELIPIDYDGGTPAKFSGSLRKFKSFNLLRGELSFNNADVWKLTAMSKVVVISEIIMGKIIVGEKELAISNIRINEVISVTAEDASEAESITASVESGTSKIYIRPIKIERKKIFNVIPNPWGKKVVSVEVIEGNEITKEPITENSGKKIGSYEVSVGSLKNEESLEFSVRKAE